ncbi:Spt20 family-domain-containing protein [Hyaloraphidium curvatum]|nr:Spt20 family-domain-containing protein [Hyaloraphidium curvatum]
MAGAIQAALQKIVAGGDGPVPGTALLEHLAPESEDLGQGAATAEASSPPSFIVRLYPNHFTLGSESGTHQYNGPLRALLEAICDERLPAEFVDLFDSLGCRFHEGSVVVDIYDYRTSTMGSLMAPRPLGQGALGDPSPHRVTRAYLRPTTNTLWADVCLLNEQANHTDWSEDKALEVERAILLATQPPICLEPTTDVVRIANLINFNRRKDSIATRKRPRDWDEKEEAETSKRENLQMMTVMDNHKPEFYPSFRKLAFVEEWRRQKAEADREPLAYGAAVDSKKKQRTGPPLLVANNLRNVRSIRFERKHGKDEAGNDVRLYTILNIYERQQGGPYSAVLRWGTVPDTAINGGTLQFGLGNKEAAQMFLKNMAPFLIERGQVMTDFAAPSFGDKGSAAAIASAPAAYAAFATPLGTESPSQANIASTLHQLGAGAQQQTQNVASQLFLQARPQAQVQQELSAGQLSVGSGGGSQSNLRGVVAATPGRDSIVPQSYMRTQQPIAIQQVLLQQSNQLAATPAALQALLTRNPNAALGGN